MKLPIYNTHSHIFTGDWMPDGFAGKLSKWLMKKPEKRVKWLTFILDRALPSQKDKLSKLANFLDTINMSQYQVYLENRSWYPSDSISTALTIDMENMGAGKAKKNYLEQVFEALELRKEDDKMRLFIMVDPRSEWLDQLRFVFSKYVKYIDGIKVYPLMGYFLNDEKLDWFFLWAKENNKPVKGHCTPENQVYYRGKGIRELLSKCDPNFPYFKEAKKNKHLVQNFAHPWHYIKLAEKYGIRVNMAHMGGYDLSWKAYIVDALRRQKRDLLYTDISFTFNKEEEQKELRGLLDDNGKFKDFVLFGDDQYVAKTQDQGNPFTKVEENIGLSNFRKIANYNPKRFLNE